MRPSFAELPGAESLRWMDPVAGDIITSSYGALNGDPSRRATLVRCHLLIWRGLLMGRDDVGAFRRELSRLAALAGVSEAEIDEVDAQVLAELLDTIAARHSRSPRVVSRLSFGVAQAACRIAQHRPSPLGRRLTPTAPRAPAPELALAKGGA